MKRSGRFLIAACMMLMAAPTVRPVAQTVLTLEECRTMALENNQQPVQNGKREGGCRRI